LRAQIDCGLERFGCCWSFKKPPRNTDLAALFRLIADVTGVGPGKSLVNKVAFSCLRGYAREVGCFGRTSSAERRRSLMVRSSPSGPEFESLRARHHFKQLRTQVLPSGVRSGS
jgi:hypothetical protein